MKWKKAGGIPKWKHNQLHRAVQKKAGKADRCENPDCTSINPKRFEWALRKGRQYSDNPEDYIQLCTPCHRRYDFNEGIRKALKAKKVGELHNRSKLKETDVLNIYSLIRKGIQNKEIALSYKIDPSTVSDIKRGKKWPHLFNNLNNQ